MKAPLALHASLAALALLFGACAQRPADQNQAALADSLTLHASFDNGLDADFARGDGTLYSYSNAEERKQGGIRGLPEDEAVKVTQGSGRFGNALLFDKKNPIRPFFKDGGNIGYNAEDWSRTVSVWMRLSPDVDLEPGYCDPVQFVGNDGNKGFIFLEFDKDSNPRFFRYAIRPLVDIWDPNRVGWAAIPFEERPMVQVQRAPFSHARWANVVFTLDHVNSKTEEPSGKLYIDGKLQGTIENWDLSFGWEPDSALLVLGAAYVGHLDELSVFDRALSDHEVRALYELPNGVRNLY